MVWPSYIIHLPSPQYSPRYGTYQPNRDEQPALVDDHQGDAGSGKGSDGGPEGSMKPHPQPLPSREGAWMCGVGVMVIISIGRPLISRSVYIGGICVVDITAAA